MLTTSFLFNKLAALQAAHSRLVSVDALFTFFSQTHTHAHYDDIHRDNIIIVTTTAVILIFNIQHTQYGDVHDILTDTNITILIVTTVLGNRYGPR